MPDALTSLVVIALGVVAGLLVIVLVKIGTISRSRDAAAQDASDIRTRLEVMRQTTADFERDLRQDLANARSEQAAGAQAARRELGDRLSELTRTNEQRLEAVRATVEQRLDVLRSENAQKLDQMRATVDEKLQTTLDERLGQSFKQVSDRLDQVHKGLGEMQSLAVGVGDLKRVLSNVKRRGTWGEMQLGALLAEILIPGQYGINVETIPGTGRRVEFALRMPGRADEPACWIPIDAKFPVEEWERLQDALERADVEAAEGARKALAGFLRQQAKMVRANYVSPPHTSDFAFLYLPTESLYAEMMARSGLADELQREHRVMIAGPSNFLALLNIVQMGFRTVAIEQRTSEVWLTLGAVRTEFRKFADVLQRAQKKLQEASNTIEEARGKTTTIERRLREVEGVPENESGRLLRGAQTGRLFEDDVVDSQAPPSVT
jgi:DNA recombination protein RmuC